MTKIKKFPWDDAHMVPRLDWLPRRRSSLRTLVRKFKCIIVAILILYLIRKIFHSARAPPHSMELKKRSDSSSSETTPDSETFQFSSQIETPQYSSESDAILTPKVKSSLPIILLSSKRDFWGLPTTIEFESVNTFNPALLSLAHPGDDRNATFVVLAREEYQYEYVDGFLIQPRRIFAGLLHFGVSDPERRWDPTNNPIIRSHSVQRLDQLVHSEDIYFPKCEPDLQGGLSGNQGPEDPRLVWSHLGEPLVIYQSISPTNSELCRHFYVVDLRSIYPPVADIMFDTARPPPIRFIESVPLSYSGQAGFHKNWALFTNVEGDIFVHTRLAPQTIYKLKPESAISPPTFSSPASDLISLELIVHHPQEDENCVTIALRGIAKLRIHQSTPFVDVVLCTSADVYSGLCDPDDPANHLYMGVIHAQHAVRGTPWYEARVVTLNSSLPFNYYSISKPLSYASIPLTDLTYTVSLNFRKTRKAFSTQELARGYLDDMLILSFGRGDKSSHFLEVEVADVLQDHYLCEDLIYEYIMAS